MVVVAAIILNLALGALYSWPVFSNHLENSLPQPSRWKHFETQLVFSMATVFLALGVIAAGQLSERHQPRALLLISAVFAGGGYVLGGVLPLRPLFLTVTIGAMAGFGIGVAYTLPISLAAKWFPDRKGLVTGLAMAGFGVGSVLWSQVFDLFLDDRLGISLTFVVYGVVFAGMILCITRFFITRRQGTGKPCWRGSRRGPPVRPRPGCRRGLRESPLTARPVADSSAARLSGSSNCIPSSTPSWWALQSA